MKHFTFLERIPVLRGWLVRWRAACSRRHLLKSYHNAISLLKRTPIESITYKKSRCVYKHDDGREFVFRPDKAAGWLYSIPFSGDFEVKETSFVKRTIEKDWVCLDVGGCFGWYSVLLAQLVGPNGAVHVFEPVPDNRECLLENIKLNMCSNVSVHPYALADTPCTATIFVPKYGVSGSLRAHASKTKCTAVGVKVSTLDEFARATALTRLDFIKADVEGAEILILEGGGETLRRFKPTLMLEVQAPSTRLYGYKPNDLFKLTAKLGYAAYRLDYKGFLVPLLHAAFSGAQLPDDNFVFVHEMRSV